jgi:site-specific DNA recombinase
MLTVAYCRVSTEEQATEGFSIEGQGEKLKAYATLRDLGEVTVIEDRGWSGKNLDRPGLSRLLTATAEGHVSNVLIWRLDRLSRNLGDLIVLADTFMTAGVGLYSFTEQLDLSSAAGRMQFHILGTFAQFYREQLVENVDMGMQQAVQSGKWINRPKTGYALVDGELIPDENAPVVRRIFRLRAEGQSYRDIEAMTGVKYSTVMSILGSRIYLGEVQRRGKWFPGRHEPLVEREEWDAAQRAHLQGRRRSKDVLAGRVRCGLCGRAATVDYNQDGHLLYRCHHRGAGCKQPRRAARGLARAVVLGLRLVGTDEDLQAAIRQELAEPGPDARQGAGRGGRSSGRALAELARKRQKLLSLYYEEKISAELFAAEERRLTDLIAALRDESAAVEKADVERDELGERFEEVAAALRDIDIEQMWASATDAERRVLVEELIEAVAFFPDHLEVKVAGAPKLNVLPSEVGLKESQTVGVGGGT